MGGNPLRLSAGVVITGPEQEPRRWLLLRAWRNWDFPKGKVEPGETPLQAALREVAEETGIVDLRFPWGEQWQETAPYNRGKVARYYLGRTGVHRIHLPISPGLGRPEHHEYRWAGDAEALQLLPPRLHPVFRWALEVVTGPGM